jgi:hypothetical protein
MFIKRIVSTVYEVANRLIEKKKLLLLYFLIGIFLVVMYFIPSDRSLCIFRNVTGFPCPGCGLTRAGQHLLHFEFQKSFEFHPLFIPLALILTLYSLQLFGIDSKTRIIARLMADKRFWVVTLCLFLTVYVIRMIILYPDVPPMVYDENSLVQKISKLFQINN